MRGSARPTSPKAPRTRLPKARFAAKNPGKFMERRPVHLGKFLSLVLRHRPDEIGLRLDEAGWADVDDLIAHAKGRGMPCTRADLAEVVATNDKQRFALSPDGARIRARQGHSVEVALGLPESEPPAARFHGTAERFLPAIRR